MVEHQAPRGRWAAADTPAQRGCKETIVAESTGRCPTADARGEVFINRAEFDKGMQKLIAARRPTMHVRTIDGVRLVELVCLVQCRSERMAGAGAWKRQAELDH